MKSKTKTITIQDIIHYIFIVFLSAFLGAPLLMLSLRWWQTVIGLTAAKLL